MEDGISTDGKGRTINFKNAILIMTSNVGSQRILELSRSDRQEKEQQPTTTTSVEDVISSVEKKDDQKEEEIIDSTSSSSSSQEVSSEKEASSIKSGGSSNTKMAETYRKYSKVVHEELEATMRPEFLNRIDEIVVFSPLDTTKMSHIASLLLQKTVERAKKEQEIDIKIEPNLLQKVMVVGSQQAQQFGARPMRRVAQRYLEDSLSDAIIQGFLQPGDAALIDFVVKNKEDYVTITRESDKKTMDVLIEALGGIGQYDEDQLSAPQSSVSSSSYDEIVNMATNGAALLESMSVP